MIKEVIFSNKEGFGYISNTMAEMLSTVKLHAEPLIFGNLELLPGSETDLEGFLCRKILYMGHKTPKSKCSIFLPNGAINLLFYLGEDDNEHYFKSIFYLSPTRIYIQYQPNGGRDYNRVNGKWK